MSFTPTELQRQILEIVDGLQHGKGREDVRDGSPVVLREGVPEAIILAELYGLGGDGPCDNDAVAALDESTTRDCVERAMAEHRFWPLVKYARPDGHEMSTRIDTNSGLREVALDGECVAIEFDELGQPTDPFACYSITREGLEVLEADGQARTTTHAELPKQWEPQPGYVGSKTIISHERFQKKGKCIPRTTLQRWVNRDAEDGDPVPTETAPDSGEKFYPEQWVRERIERWNPRQPKNV